MTLIKPDTYLRECLTQARYYEFCADYERALTVLSPVWSNLEEKPRVEDLDARLACEILMVCGGVISYQGQMQQRKSYQEMAADLLTDARDRASRINDRELIAESEKQTGLAYWRLGQFENAIAFFNTVLSKYTEAEQVTTTICLNTQINLLMLFALTNENLLAHELLKKIEPFIVQSENLWLKNSFNNQASGVHLKAGNFRLAIPYLEKAIEYSRINRNDCFLGNALNNLALAYVELSDIKAAGRYIDQAIEVYSKLNQSFTLGMAFETKAQVLIADGKFKEALHSIDESIRILEKGENYKHLAESLWTRTLIVAHDGDRHQTIRQFNYLMRVVEAHLSRVEEDFYIKKFGNLVYLETGTGFYEKTENYREHLLDVALARSGGLIVPTAKLLQMSHQNVRNLCRSYPNTAEKNAVKLRARQSNSAPSVKDKGKKEVEATEAENVDSSIAMILTTNRLAAAGLFEGMMVEVRQCEIDDLDFTKPAVIARGDIYHFGYLMAALGMYAFLDDDGGIEMTFVASEISEAGQIVGVYDEQQGRFFSLDD